MNDSKPVDDAAHVILVPDPYDSCLSCGSWHYTHQTYNESLPRFLACHKFIWDGGEKRARIRGGSDER